MSCTGDKPCNCQVGFETPLIQNGPYVHTWKVFETGFENEKPGETIKRRVNDFQEQVKNMLNNMIEELGIKVDIMEINLNDNGDKIDEVVLYWDVEK